MAMAGVYPPGMKLMSSWCREDRGLGIGVLVEAVGWQYVFMFLALGPAFGTWSMLQLRRLPEAVHRASGHR
jgi:hypothetical protein